MPITGNIAHFGERKNSHALLACASELEEFFTELVPYTDLPAPLPPQVSLTPFLRGFAHNDYYILARTLPDVNASRQGMVFTHVVAFDAVELAALTDISPVIASLPTKVDREPVQMTVEIDDVKNSAFRYTLAASPPPIPGYSGLVYAILNSANRENPPVWVAEDGFDLIVCTLWQHLWPAGRRNLSFRLSFGPNDLTDPSPDLVVSPPSLRGRWGGYQVIDSTTSRTGTSRAAALLLGEPEGEAVRSFQNSLESELSLRDLPHLEACLKYYEQIPQTDPAAALSLVRLVASFSPDHGRAVDIKVAALEDLVRITSSADATHIFAFGNLDLGAFRDGYKTIADAVSDWVVDNLPATVDHNRCATCNLLKKAAGSNDWWSEAIVDGVRTLFATDPGSAATAWWQCCDGSPTIVKMGNRILSHDDELEHWIVEAAPATIYAELANVVREFATHRRWMKLHALAVARSLDPHDALVAHLQIDTDEKSFDALRWLVSELPTEDVFHWAAELSNVRLGKVVAEVLAAEPVAFDYLNPDVPENVAIFESFLSLPLDKVLFKNTHVLRFRDYLLDCWLDSRILSVPWSQLSLTPLADLATYSRRTEIWPRLTGTVLERVLSCSAEGWINRFKRDSVDIEPPEPPLRSAIMGPANRKALLFVEGRNSLKIGLSAFGLFDALTESDFIGLLKRTISRKGRVSSATSVEIGSLVARNRWHRAAKTILEKANSGVNGLEPAIAETWELLGHLDRLLNLRFSRRKLQDADYYQALAEVAATLYPTGIGDKQIWLRSGGKPASVNVNLSGEEQWRAATTILENGGGGRDLTLQKLISCMREDYPRNAVLKVLQQAHFH